MSGTHQVVLHPHTHNARNPPRPCWCMPWNPTVTILRNDPLNTSPLIINELRLYMTGAEHAMRTPCA